MSTVFHCDSVRSFVSWYFFGFLKCLEKVKEEFDEEMLFRHKHLQFLFQGYFASQEKVSKKWILQTTTVYDESLVEALAC